MKKGLFFVLNSAIALCYLRSMTGKLEIAHVLENWDYQRGLKVLEKYGDNAALLGLLRGGLGTKSSSFFESKLKRELTRLSEAMTATPTATPAAHSPVQEAEPAPVQTRPAPERPYAREFEQYPASVQTLIKEKNQRVREMDFLRGQLELLAPEERKTAAFRILELDDEIDEHWEKIKYYDEHQRLPEEAAQMDEVAEVLAGIVTIADTFRQEANYKSYVTKAKKGSMNSAKYEFYKAALEAIRKKRQEMMNG